MRRNYYHRPYMSCQEHSQVTASQEGCPGRRWPRKWAHGRKNSVVLSGLTTSIGSTAAVRSGQGMMIYSWWRGQEPRITYNLCHGASPANGTLIEFQIWLKKKNYTNSLKKPDSISTKSCSHQDSCSVLECAKFHYVCTGVRDDISNTCIFNQIVNLIEISLMGWPNMKDLRLEQLCVSDPIVSLSYGWFSCFLMSESPLV